jgi:SAM-dependent methyltransferase
MTTTDALRPDWVTPLYERVLDRAGAGPARTLLDLGCGAGHLCRMAADLGAQVSGVDTDRAEIEQAAALVPEGTFEVGDMHALPYPTATYDGVACVQSIMHVANPLTALREAARVARPGAPVVITVWGKEEDCDIGAFGLALAALLPRPTGPTDPTVPPPLSADGRLERLAKLADLTVAEIGEVVCQFRYPDEDGLLRDLLDSALGRQAMRVASPATVRRAVVVGLADYRTADGGYRLDNTFRYLVGSPT